MEREQLTTAGGWSDRRMAAVGGFSSACERARRAHHDRVVAVPAAEHLSDLPGGGRLPWGRGCRALGVTGRTCRLVRQPAPPGTAATHTQLPAHTGIVTWPLEPSEEKPDHEAGSRPGLF